MIENIKQFSLNGALVKVWGISKDIVNFYGLVNFSLVLRVISGKRQTYKGYKWSL